MNDLIVVVREVTQYKQRQGSGRPSTQSIHEPYYVIINLFEKTEQIEKYHILKSMFVMATNQLDSKTLAGKKILTTNA